MTRRPRATPPTADTAPRDRDAPARGPGTAIEVPSVPAPFGCTALRFRKAARRVSQIYDAFLAPFGLTITQFGLLAHVQRLPGSTIGSLAAELVMDPTTLTRNLRPLRQRQLVELAPDPRDRRARTLRLTPAGREALRDGRAGWSRAQAHMADVLGADHAPLSGAIDTMLARLGG